MRVKKIEKEVLSKYKTVAVVGASPDPQRHSNAVMAYLIAAGYKVYPVNPTVPEVLGRKTYPDLKSVPQPVEIVDVFRAPDKVLPTVDEAIGVGAKVLWLQEGVVNEEAADKAKTAGMTVVMDRCIAKVHGALTGAEH